MKTKHKPNFEDNIMHFSETFANLRRGRGQKVKTYKQISKEIYQKTKTHISHTQLSKYVKMEKGETQLIYPKINIIMAIAEYYDVSIEYLMGLSDTKKYDIEYKKGSELFGLTDEAMNMLSKMKTHETLQFNPKYYKQMSETEFVSFLIVHFVIKFEQALIPYLDAKDIFNSYKEKHIDDNKRVKEKYILEETTIIDNYQTLEEDMYKAKYIITQVVDNFLEDLVYELTKKETDE